MEVMQPAVLVGAYDWDETSLPRAEFERRVKEVLRRLAASGHAGLVVYGNKLESAALAYLTNFTPKLESAFALLALDGSVRLHSAGSPHMMVNAQRLTWVEGVKPLRDAGKQIAEWAEALAPGPLGFWTTEAMPADLPPRLSAALPARPLNDMGARLDPLLRAKSPVERRLMREARSVLARAAAALRERFERGGTARQAALAAEDAANDAGAQDVRVLASLVAGGTPTALDSPDSTRLDPLLAYIAVRRAGYWADGSLTLATAPHATIERTRAGLAAMLEKARAGVATAELAAIARDKLGGMEVHPAARKPVAGIGLSLIEREASPNGVEVLEAGRVYTLRAGVRTGAGDNAILSAMIEVKPGGADILWSALD
ncbi:MAG TPA: M24 family metallopeptidase [Stellaceae bacterium]|nr:M24 family metallopeptidase [Stellaceae bacterium]